MAGPQRIKSKEPKSETTKNHQRFYKEGGHLLELPGCPHSPSSVLLGLCAGHSTEMAASVDDQYCFQWPVPLLSRQAFIRFTLVTSTVFTSSLTWLPMLAAFSLLLCFYFGSRVLYFCFLFQASFSLFFFVISFSPFTSPSLVLLTIC